jgi:putative restriction endonuclease
MAFDISLVERGRLYTRPELADIWGYRTYHALARGVVTPRESGCILLFVTREKQESLTQYRDFISADRLHWEGEVGHQNDDRIARSHESGEEIHLFYRDIHHTPFRYHGQVLITRFERRTDDPSRFVFQLVHDLGPADDLASRAQDLVALDETERETVTKARVGQGRFRDELLEYWRGCAITGLDRADLVRASHIKPWRYSDNRERVHPFNGLLLLPQYDHLFDRGYITFDDTGRLEPSPSIRTLRPSILGIDTRARLRVVEPEHRPYLEYHREEVFLKPVAR